MKIGVDYYPEHWDESMWQQDVEQMKRAGVKIVRLAEFAWSRLEPQEGQFEFGWLDRAIRLFENAGIEVFLGTPTCTPPQWMFEAHPEIIQVDKTGHRVPVGIRGHRCMNSPIFRTYCEKMITAMVEHYRDWEIVTGYQIDNELEANHCCCPVCQEAFRDWVRNKYHSIDKVNEVWGNAVWSGEYTDFSQIMPPFGEHQTWLNPSYTLDFNRYASQSTVDYVRFQLRLIRAVDPEIPVTTNNWLCENMPDFYDLFENLDFVSYDNYPATRLPEDPEELYSHAFHLDLMRGIKRRNFWIMEQLSGGLGSWMPMSPTTRPGMIRGYSWQAIAHGADAVLHFRWRTACTGAEMFWHGLLDHDNIPGRRYREFEQLCAEVADWQELDGSRVENRVAILYGSDQEYAFKLQPQVDGMYYMEQLKLFHDGFTACGVGVDLIDENSDLSGYQVVVAPTLFVEKQQIADRLCEVARRGGTVVLTNRSGVKDEYNRCVMEALPGIFAGLAGVTVEEYDPIGLVTQSLRCHFGEGGQRPCTQWCDILKPDTAEVLAEYADQFYRGRAAVTCNSFGTGWCYYIGTVSDRAFYRQLAGYILDQQKMEYLTDLPTGLERTQRKGRDHTYTFWFNNTQNPLEYRGQCFEPFDMKIERSDEA